jgi:hypothetical protein
MASQASFNDYIRWRMKLTSGPTIRECHTRYCCSSPRVKHITDQHLQDAKRFVEHEAVIGVVDRYDESMVCAESRLSAIWPTIDLSYIPQNVSNSDERSLQQRIDDVKARMDDDVLELVAENNQRDLELYTVANQVLDDTCAGVTDFDARLRAFRDRCEARRRWWRSYVSPSGSC